MLDCGAKNRGYALFPIENGKAREVGDGELNESSPFSTDEDAALQCRSILTPSSCQSGRGTVLGLLRNTDGVGILELNSFINN